MYGLYFLKKLYIDHVKGEKDAKGDDEQVEYNRHYTLRCYLLLLVGTSMFVDKNATYVDVVYLKYFIDLTMIHQYN